MFSDLRRSFYVYGFHICGSIFHVFTIFNKNRSLHFALHVLSNLIGEIPEMDIFRIAGIQHSERILQDHIPLIGTQIMAILRPVRLLLQLDMNTVKCDIPDIFRIVTVDQDAILSDTVDILETDIPDISHIRLCISLHRSDGNGFCLAPPMYLGEQAGIDIQIGECDIFYTAFIT